MTNRTEDLPMTDQCQIMCHKSADEKPDISEIMTSKISQIRQNYGWMGHVKLTEME